MKFANAPLLQLLALALLFVATPAASAESPALFAAAAADEELKDNEDHNAPRSLLEDNEVVLDAVDEDAEQEKAGNLRSGAGNRRLSMVLPRPKNYRVLPINRKYRLFKPTN